MHASASADARFCETAEQAGLNGPCQAALLPLGLATRRDRARHCCRAREDRKTVSPRLGGARPRRAAPCSKLPREWEAALGPY
jgi:hypothetical protein